MFSSLRYLFPLMVLALIAVVSLGGGHETPVQLRAYVGARIIPVTAPEIVDGVLLVRGETIAAVGKRGCPANPRKTSRRRFVSSFILMRYDASVASIGRAPHS